MLVIDLINNEALIAKLSVQAGLPMQMEMSAWVWLVTSSPKVEE